MTSRRSRSVTPAKKVTAPTQEESSTAITALNRPALARMLKIHHVLRRGPLPDRPITCTSLTAMLDKHGDDQEHPSEKTVYRDLKFMRERMNLPIEWDFTARSYCYTRDDVVFPIGHGLSEEELIAVSVARQSLAVFQGVDFARQLERAHDKLMKGVLSETGLSIEGNISEYLSVRTPGAGIADPKVFKAVTIALLDRRELKAEYQSRGRVAPTLRRLAPYHLACVASRWILIARDLEKDEIRTYILARFRNPIVTQATFLRPEQFDVNSYLGLSFGVWTGRGDILVRLHLTAEAAHHATERNWHPTQQITPRPGGAVEVSFKLSDLSEVTRWALSFGSDVTVISPPELRAAIREEGRRMMERNC